MSQTYKIQLNEDQFKLLGRLISSVRLGTKTQFSNAAFDLCEMFEQMDSNAFESSYDDVKFNIVVEGPNGNVVVTVDGDEAIFEV